MGPMILPLVGRLSLSQMSNTLKYYHEVETSVLCRESVVERSSLLT